MMKRNKIVLIFIILAVALCAFAFSACATIGYVGGKDVPELKKNEVLFIERNRLSFARGMEIDEIDVLERCNITFVSEGESFTVTAESLRSGVVGYESFELDEVGSNKQITITYGDAVNYIYYDVNSYKANFYLNDDKTELYKTVDASAELTDSLGLSVWVNLVRQNYSTDEKARETDGDRAIKFDGWYDSDSHRATGLYLFTPPKSGNEVVADFHAGFISDEQLAEMDISYDDGGRRIFEGYSGSDDFVRVPEGVTYIDFNELFKNGSAFKQLRLPSTVSLDMPFMTAVNSVGLERIEVDGGNSAFASYNGALYSKDYSTLYFMPSDCSDKQFHPSLSEIASYACSYWRIGELEIPENVTTLNYYCFAYSSLSSVVGIENVKNIKAGVFFGSNIEMFSDGTAQYIVLGGENSGKLILSMILKEKESITAYKLADGTVGISGNVFSRCSDLESIDLGSELEEIGASAFSGCAKLQSIELPASLKRMGGNVFYGCASLASVTGLSSDITFVDGSGKEYGHCLPSGIFYGCKALENAPLPEGLLQIGSTAFYQCSKISEVKIPDTVYHIGDSAFSQCAALKTVALPTSLRSLGTSVFSTSGLEEIDLSVCPALTSLPSNCFRNTKLKNIEFPDWITEIPSGCFYSSSSSYRHLETVVLNKVTVIGDEAFTGCTALASIDLGIVEYIAYRAFRQCTALTEVVLPDTVTYVGGQAFTSCSKLKSFTLGTGVKTFGQYFLDPDGVTFTALVQQPAIYTCNALEQINVKEGNPYFKSVDGVLYGRSIAGVDYGEGGVLYTVPMAYPDASFISAESTRVVAPYAAHYQVNLTEATFTEGVENIGLGIFYNSKKLTTVRLPSTVKNIGANIVYQCSAMKTFSVSDKNEIYSAEGNLLYKGDELTMYLQFGSDFAIKDGTAKIAFAVFMDNKDITEIVVPDSVTEIDERAFRGCSSVRSIYIGSGLKNLDSSAFALLSSLETITVSEDNPYFKAVNNVLYSKDGKTLYLAAAGNGMTELTLESGVTKIMDYAFSYHKTLKNVVLPDGVRTVGDYAFYECRGVEYLICSESLEKIGAYAFAFDSSTTLEKDTFKVCDALKFIVFYGNLNSIGDFAFTGNYGIEYTFYKMTYAECKALIAASGRNKVHFTHGCSDGDGKYYNNDGTGIIRAIYSEKEPTITHDGYGWFYFDEEGNPKLYE